MTASRAGRRILLALVALLPAACAETALPPSAPRPAAPLAADGIHPYTGPLIQCVPYAQQVSGIDIRGDAWTWWGAAAGRYERGHKPRFMAVLVLSRTGRLHLGHVAVVVDIVGPREIRVTHANFGSDSASRHVIYDAMPATDVSPGNDWSLVRFWNYGLKAWGTVYPAYGFIYPERVGPTSVPIS